MKRHPERKRLKKESNMGKLAWILTLTLILSLAISCGGSYTRQGVYDAYDDGYKDGYNQGYTDAIAGGESATTPTQEPATTPTFKPIVIAGTSDKTSPPFTVTTNEWTIDWSYVPDPEYPDMGVFGFFVYPRGETAVYVEAVLFPEGTRGSTYIYAGAGQYYIKVTAANVKSWEVVISPP